MYQMTSNEMQHFTLSTSNAESFYETLLSESREMHEK